MVKASISCRLPQSTNDKVAAIHPHISPEPYAILNHHGFLGLEPVFEMIHQCKGFHNIITKKPTLWLPCQTSIFMYTLFCPEGGFLMEPMEILPLIKSSYDLEDEGMLMLVYVTLEDIQRVYKEVVINPANSFDDTIFKCPKLMSEYIVLFDFMQKVFMGYNRTFDVVTSLKFKVFVVVYLNLDINWARYLLVILHEEAKQLTSRRLME